MRGSSPRMTMWRQRAALVIPGRAEGASPESITTTGSMDSGQPLRGFRNDKVTRHGRAQPFEEQRRFKIARDRSAPRHCLIDPPTGLKPPRRGETGKSITFVRIIPARSMNTRIKARV